MTEIHVGPTGVVYVGLQGPGVYRSKDNGLTWTSDESIPGWWAYVSKIISISADTVYAAGGKGLYRSIDTGTTWSAMDGGGTLRGIVCLAISPARSVYVIDYTGVVSKSTDGGENWVRLDSLPVSQVYEMELGRHGELYVGTYKTGMFTSTNEGASWGNKYIGSSVGLIRATSDGTLLITKDGTLFRSDSLGDNLIDLEFDGGVSDVVVNSKGTIFASTWQAPSIRYLTQEGNWMDYTSGGLPHIEDLALSPSEELYALSFAGSGYIARQATTSGVANHIVSPLPLLADTKIPIGDVISISVYNSVGSRCFFSQYSPPRSDEEILDLNDLDVPPGIYFTHVVTRHGSQVLKVLLAK